MFTGFPVVRFGLTVLVGLEMNGLVVVYDFNTRCPGFDRLCAGSDEICKYLQHFGSSKIIIVLDGCFGLY